jgi:hypothetical protein
MKKSILVLSFLILISQAQVKAQMFRQGNNEREYPLFSETMQPDQNRGQGSGPNPDPGGESPIGSGTVGLLCLSLGYAFIKHSRKEDE